MRVCDMERGKFYRVTESNDAVRPGTILLCTEHDFILHSLAGAATCESYMLWAVVVHNPSGLPGPGFTMYRRWDNGVRVEQVNFQFDGMTPPAEPAPPQPHVRPHCVDALGQLAQGAGHYVGPWNGNPEFTRYVQRMAKQARGHPQGDALAPIVLAYYRGEPVQWCRGGEWHDAKRYAPAPVPRSVLVGGYAYNHGIQWSFNSTYRIKPRESSDDQ